MKTLSRLISLSLCLIMIVSCVIAGTVSAEEQLYTDVKPKRWSYEDIKKKNRRACAKRKTT